MLVGAAQPFFQCTPSLLAANWFGESETTLAATLALNSNQLGIAFSVCGRCWSRENGRGSSFIF